jgi:hypothetical protein
MRRIKSLKKQRKNSFPHLKIPCFSNWQITTAPLPLRPEKPPPLPPWRDKFRGAKQTHKPLKVE